jgi:hypothetical protein
MSIWTELLFLHGHIATPTALALIAPAAAHVAPAAAHVAADPAAPAGPAPPAAAATAEPYHHPLRTVGQLC